MNCRGELGSGGSTRVSRLCCHLRPDTDPLFLYFSVELRKICKLSKVSYLSPLLPPPHPAAAPSLLRICSRWKAAFAFLNGILSCVPNSQGRFLPERLSLQHLSRRTRRQILPLWVIGCVSGSVPSGIFGGYMHIYR